MGGKSKTKKTEPVPAAQQDKPAGDADQPTGPSAWTVFSDGVKLLASRNSASLLPVGLWSGLYAGAELAHHTLAAGYPVAGVAAAAGGAGGLLAGLGGLLRKRVPAGWWPWLTLNAANATAWCGAAALHGVGYGMAAWALGSLAVGAAPWWNRNAPAYPTEQPRPSGRGMGTDAQQCRDLVTHWTAHVADEGPLSGSKVTKARPYEYGIEAVVELRRGRQSIETLQANVSKVETGIDYYRDEIVFSPDRSLRPHQVRLRIATRSPSKQTAFFDRPRYEDGAILLGQYSDGVGEARYRLYTDNSMLSGFILGSPKSGKSRMVETIALTAMAETPTIVIYLDGQSGASSPLLWEYATLHGGPEDADAVLHGLLTLKEYRQAYNRHHKLTGFTPSDEMPGVLVVIDECHRIFNKDNAAAWAEASKEIRKVGGGLLGASQEVDVKNTFGGHDGLRAALAAGNGLALKTASNVQQNIFPGLKADLVHLPDRPGYGYTVAIETDNDDDGRTAPFRGRWLVDEQSIRRLKLSIPDDVHTAEWWFAQVAGRHELDARSAAAMGPVFTNRHAAAERVQAALAAIFADDQALAAELERMREEAHKRVYKPVKGLAGIIGQAARRFHQGGGQGGEVKPFGTARLGGGIPPVATLRPRTPEQLPDAQRRLYEAVGDQGATAAALVTALGISQARVYQLAGALVDKKFLTKRRGGGWEHA
jgi:hypothetical protein